MAGVNPATGKFEVNYYPGAPKPSNVTVTQGKGGAFTNNKWTMSDPAGNPLPAPGASPPAAGGGTPTGTTQQQQTAPEDPMKAYYDNLRIQQQAAVRDSLQGVFGRYGLQSLYGKIVEYAKLDYSADTIMLMLRQTAEYKNRFPAMEALAAKGRGITEASYIEYEMKAANYEHQYGLPQGMLSSYVTDLLSNEVSADELLNRVKLAAASSVTAPDDFKAEMRDRFNVDAGGLTAYFLDPDLALPMLEKQYATALIGTEARRQGVGGITTNYLSLLQDEGITQQGAQEGFAQVARQGEFTGGAGEVATNEDLAQAAFGTSADAAKKAARIAGSRTGRFAGGGQFVGNSSGLGGIGGSST